MSEAAAATTTLGNAGRRLSAGVGLITLLIVVVVLALPDTASGAATIRVSVKTGNDVTGNGTLSSPYRTIKKGLGMASAGDVVRVAPGVYSAATGETFPLTLNAGVALIGSGDFDDTQVIGNGSSSVFTVVDGNYLTILEGFHIRGGGGNYGAGIFVAGGSSPLWGAQIKRNHFYQCEADLAGGAIYIDGSSSPSAQPRISDNEFFACSAPHGGAIYAHEATFALDRNFFYGCAAVYGGAIRGYDTGGAIERCTFVGCLAQVAGGGIQLSDTGGSTLDVRECRFMACTSLQTGGGMQLQPFGQLQMANCIFEQCAATVDGGALELVEAAANIDGTTIRGSSGAGAALAHTDVGLNDPCQIRSSILWANGGNDVSSGLDIQYTLVQEASSGTGVISGADPRFISMDSEWPRLSWASPCIDAGDPSSTLVVDAEQVKRPDTGDSPSGRVDMGACEYGTVIGRLSGPDRFDTACAVVHDRFTRSQVAVLATGRNFPDALCASGLAGVYNAPVLLTQPDHLPSVVRDKLLSMMTREAFIVGGSDVVSDAVADELRAMGIDVIRLEGPDRYATSRAVADHIAGQGYTDICFVARGDMFPDALALAPLAANVGDAGPVLLVQPSSLPPAIDEALQAHGYNKAMVAGSEDAVGSVVFDAIDAHVPEVWRSGGVNRYETAALIAEDAVTRQLADPDFIGISIGDNFPDALAGGAACGAEQGLLLLTLKSELHQYASDFLGRHRTDLREIFVFGGSDVVEDQIIFDCQLIAP